MSKSTPFGYRLIKKYNWKSKWFIDHSKKNLYIRSLFNDFLIFYLISSFYHFYSLNNLILIKNVHNKFVKIYCSTVAISRYSNNIKILFSYNLNKDLRIRFFRNPYKKYLLRNNKRLTYVVNHFKRKYILYLKFKNNIQLMTNELVHIVYIRRRFFQNRIEYMWNVLEIFYIHHYKLGRILGLFLNKFSFWGKVKIPYKGFKFIIRGKLRGKSRRRTIFRVKGKFKTNLVNSEVQYIFKNIRNIHGAYGIKIWLLLTRKKYQLKLNYKTK